MTVQPEFSHPVVVADIPPEGLTVALSANAAERAALASRFDLLDLPLLEGRLVLHPLAPGGVSVQGSLQAQVQQACVISGTPVDAALAEDFIISFLSEADDELEGDTLLLEADDKDIEILDGPELDLGEILAQQLALALDPYPRAPEHRGTASPQQWSAGPKTPENHADSDKKRPFDVLKQLRDKA